MDTQYPVFTMKNECQDCYKCIRSCQVKAIKVKNSSASVIPEKCISCGQCIKICPQNAKKARNDVEKVKDLIRAQKKVFVSIAPTYSGVYSASSSKLISALKQLGFFGVSETALGAQEVSIQTAKLLRNSNQLHISSACPAIVDFIKYYMPSLSSYITPLASPALTHAKMLREEYGDDISVVFIGPCIAKKNEAQRHSGLMDYALTFAELNEWLESEGVVIEQMPDVNESFKIANSHEGALYPLEGGMIETIKKSGVSDCKYITISSIEGFKTAVENLSPQDIHENIFIEALACDGGCVNGPGISSDKSRVSIIADIIQKVNVRNEIPSEPISVVEEHYDVTVTHDQNCSIEEITNALHSIGKVTLEDELNCGGCGYESCKTFAEALVRGNAESSMCVSYMRKIAMKKAGAMLRCMPSGVVMVNENMKIVEANEAFVKMLAKDLHPVFRSQESGLAGANLERIIPCTHIFKSALATGLDVHKEHYPINGLLYDISAFTIEPGKLVGAVITDVTKSELKREQIAKKAQDVINKNIVIVQEIACLLGEHVVDTELLLTSITEGYDNKNESDE